MKSLQQFDLNLLLILDALISECHVSRAAQRMHLSQSAMSHALNRLRRQLDDPILVRCGNGLQPTPRASEMLSQVRHIIRLLEQTLSPNTPFVAATSQRKFTIACTDYFEVEYFPKLLQQLQCIAPNVVIEIEMIMVQTISHRLQNQAVDLVIGIDSSHKLPSHLIKQHWRSQPLSCLIGKGNKLLSHELTLAQYCAGDHVAFLDATESSSNMVDDWLAQQQLSRRHIARVVNYMAAARAICVTDAIMTLPVDMANSFCQMLPVAQITPPANMPNIEMDIVHHPLFSADEGLTWLISQIGKL